MTHRLLRTSLLSVAIVTALLLADYQPVQGNVVSVIVDRRVDILGGRAFGQAGAYEMLVGRILFAFDPANRQNRAIVDLELAPRNADGLVEAWADFRAFQPKDPARRRGIGLVEVSNRGRLAAFQYLNLADTREPDPWAPEHFGDGLLMDLGLTIVIIGWQYDIPEEGHALGLRAPFARDGAEALRGLARSDWTLDRSEDVLLLGHMNRPGAYPPVAPGRAGDVLTVRESREGARQVLPRQSWEFIRLPSQEKLGAIRLEGGFQAGKIYELVYEAQDPHVVGVGLAAVRDVISYAKYDPEALFPVERGIAFGFSQTGRFLRHFLYQGLNTDERGRKAYDGMLIQVAGAGRGSFNHRFAQPSRDGHPYSAFFYPSDVFPFTSLDQEDPLNGSRGGLLSQQRDDHVPLIFQTNADYEYWGRAASLIHTSADGARDVPLHPNERIYLLAGGQHMVTWLEPSHEYRIANTPAYRGNPVDFRLTLRALTRRLVEWVDRGVDPPPSTYPHVADGTLVHPPELAFPPIPGVRGPGGTAHVAYRTDYGPRFESEGVVTNQPPELGPSFPSLVPQVDELGNTRGGIRPYELRAPLATYTPWLLRGGPWNQGPGRPQVLDNYIGSYIPLPRTEAARRTTGDPRPSLEALYGSAAEFLAKVREAAEDLVDEGFLLRRDVDVVEARATTHWNWLMGVELGSR